MTSPAPPATGRAWRAWARACSQPRSARIASESLASASKRCNSCRRLAPELEGSRDARDLERRGLLRSGVDRGEALLRDRGEGHPLPPGAPGGRGRIKYKRVCAVDGEEVGYDDIAKGYDLGGGEMVILTDEDFADLPLTSSHAIEV